MPHHPAPLEAPRPEIALADEFREAGWSVEEEVPAKPRPVDLLIKKGKLLYALEMKSAPEGRSDRLIPLLAQAILEAEAAARAVGKGASPLAVVHAPRVSDSAVENLHRFAEEYAPGVAMGVFDQQGLRSFKGSQLQSLNRKPIRPQRIFEAYSNSSKVSLFSGVNQWLLKVLLAPRLPEALLSAPRDQYRNASQLAKSAGVSVMSAFRFVRQLQEEGFLHESQESIRLVRIVELMQRWQSAGPSSRELRMRWLIRNSAPDALVAAVRSAFPPGRAGDRRSVGVEPSSPPRVHGPIRGCLGLFAAAELLGFGFVHGAPRHLYIERADSHVLNALGLVVAQPHENVDVYVRIPRASASVFRAVVDVDHVPVSDIIQVWLDVGSHAARGSAQAEQIWNRVLAPHLIEK